MLVASVVLMLLIIIPLFVAITIIAIRYRESNQDSAYAPKWEHSTKLELLIWAAPLLIVITLGAMTWIGTHKLDPYSSLTRIDDNKPLNHAQVDALEVDVIALNWKWLFLYPEYDIATVGKLVAPVDVPILFRISATDIMNSFFIPTMAGQIYAMPGMQTQLIAVMNETGKFKGISANYSGHGFNHMDFPFVVKTREQFQQWTRKISNNGGALTQDEFRELAQPSADVPIHSYADYTDHLFREVVRRCYAGAATCRWDGSGGAMPAHMSESAHASAESETAAAEQVAAKATP